MDWLKNELKVDHTFNYKKTENLVLKLKELMPEGFDLYFVGGDFLEAAIFRNEKLWQNCYLWKNFTNEFNYAPQGLKKYGPCISQKINNKRLFNF